MQVITNRSELTPLLLEYRRSGKTIGFVPTMGALHQGHLSLIAESRRSCDITVASVFVNPTQFNDPRDLEKYPRQPEKDIAMLASAGCEFLYLPTEGDVYPEGKTQSVDLDFQGFDKILEGASRPGHFAGVAQVVEVLLETAVPDLLFLGQKDYQQCIILKQLLRHMKAHGYTIGTEIRYCSIIRESNGLAMSSRNERLSAEIRQRAGAIQKTLQYAVSLLPVLDDRAVEAAGYAALESIPDLRPDYFVIRDAETFLEPNADSVRKVILTAVYAGGVRLLDNVIANS